MIPIVLNEQQPLIPGLKLLHHLPVQYSILCRYVLCCPLMPYKSGRKTVDLFVRNFFLDFCISALILFLCFRVSNSSIHGESA